MRTFGIIVLVVLGVVVGLPAGAALWAVGRNNAFVNMDEQVKQTYAQVQNVMARQAELIPALVDVVRAEAKFEAGTLTAVTEARSKLSAVARLDPEKLAGDPKLQEQLIAAQAASSQAMLAINAVREAYPQLQTNQSFQNLMAELAGSQNRIAVERRRAQFAVEEYNAAIRRFPALFVAQYGGHEAKPYYQAPEVAQTMPKLNW